MSDWVNFQVSAYGNEEKPMGSYTMVEPVRKNSKALIGASAHNPIWPIVNTVWTTTNATYVVGSCFYRSPKIWIPSAHQSFVVRHLKCRALVKTSSGAQTVTMRVFGGPRFAVPSNTPEADFVTVTLTTTTSTTYVEVTGTLAIQHVHTTPCEDGFDDDEPPQAYRCAYIGIQGKISGGATLSFAGFSFEAVNP